MKPQAVFLVCNSHLDPVYMWGRDEGIVEAIATYRVAADICEQNEGFVFNHNEALLYEYVRENEPALFRRIQRLVERGRWHIMGGWYLQPDCNLPCGESFVRQIFAGKRYFQEHFGGRMPTTAINFDSFGHSRGLVQVLAKSGFDSYLFCRPGESQCHLESDDFTWVGFDGSRVTCHRSSEHYNTPRGKARRDIEAWLESHSGQEEILYLWGIGNHGGGPSKLDVEQVNALIAENGGVRHSTPEEYFQALQGKPLPEFADDLNPVAQGSYTNHIRIKQRHRALENALFLTEKMAAHAALAGLMEYPGDELLDAERDLLFCQFHDILPGTVIRQGEQEALRIMDHGLEALSRVRLRAFFALTAGQRPMEPGVTPIFAYNPHPHPVSGVWECEFSLPPDHNAAALEGDNINLDEEETIIVPVVYHNGQPVASQLERHHSHKSFESRKRSVFFATLPPSSMTRFDCRFVRRRVRDVWEYPGNAAAGPIRVETESMRLSIDRGTGLLESYCVAGKEILSGRACKLLVIEDPHTCYGWGAERFDKVVGEFRLMGGDEAEAFRGFGVPAAPVRVIEDGAAQTVVEALFAYQASAARLLYKIGKQGTGFEIELTVYWQEKARLLKLAMPTVLAQGEYWGQTAYGAQRLASDGREVCSQRWAGLFSGESAFTWCGDSGYGSSCGAGELRMTLLRSPLYLANEFSAVNPPDPARAHHRSDQGERSFRFAFSAGDTQRRRQMIEAQAAAFHEAPVLLSLNPSGEGEPVRPALHLDNPAVQATVFKKKEGAEGYVIRLFESTGRPGRAVLSVPMLDLALCCDFQGFEVKTVLLEQNTLTELAGLDV